MELNIVNRLVLHHFCFNVHFVSENVFVFHKMSAGMWDKYNRNSKGWSHDPIAVVHPRIYLGSALGVNIDVFKKYKITHVINCATSEHTVHWFKRAFPGRYACMEAEDDLNFDITSVYRDFESIMNQYLADPECRSIYVHCQCGINRSAFLLLIYMCVKFQYSMESVVKNVLLQRPCCFRNPSFRKQVEEYIKKLE